MKTIKVTNEYAVAQFKIVLWASQGFFGIDKDYIALDGTQIISLGDNLEIDRVYLPNSGKDGHISVHIIGTDVNSLMPVDRLSGDVIWDIVEQLSDMILYE